MSSRRNGSSSGSRAAEVASKNRLHMDRSQPQPRINDPSLAAGRRKEIDNVMKRARAASPGAWDRKLLEVEEKDPNRWRHTGYKQMYLEHSRSRSSSRSPHRRSPMRRSRSPARRSRSPMRRSRSPIRRSPIRRAASPPMHRRGSPPRRSPPSRRSPPRRSPPRRSPPPRRRTPPPINSSVRRPSPLVVNSGRPERRELVSSSRREPPRESPARVSSRAREPPREPRPRAPQPRVARPPSPPLPPQRKVAPPPQQRSPSASSSCSNDSCSVCSPKNKRRPRSSSPPPQRPVKRPPPPPPRPIPTKPLNSGNAAAQPSSLPLRPTRELLKAREASKRTREEKVLEWQRSQMAVARRIKREGERRSPGGGSPSRAVSPAAIAAALADSSDDESSASDEPPPGKMTLSERFGKMAQWSADRSATIENMRITRRDAGLHVLIERREPADDASDDGSLPPERFDHEPAPVGAYPEELLAAAPGGLPSWDDVRVRYDYYKKRGYLRGLTLSDYVKWEEWWYKYQEWLKRERAYELWANGEDRPRRRRGRRAHRGS